MTKSDEFKEAAKELVADENEARWEERLKKLAKHKSDPEAPHRNPVVQKKP